MVELPPPSDTGDGDGSRGVVVEHAAVAFVLHQDQGAGFGDGRIDARRADVPLQEFLPQHLAADLDQGIGDASCKPSGSFSSKAGDFAGLVDGRHDDEMGRLLAGQLEMYSPMSVSMASIQSSLASLWLNSISSLTMDLSPFTMRPGRRTFANADNDGVGFSAVC